MTASFSEVVDTMLELASASSALLMLIERRDRPVRLISSDDTELVQTEQLIRNIIHRIDGYVHPRN